MSSCCQSVSIYFVLHVVGRRPDKKTNKDARRSSAGFSSTRMELSIAPHPASLLFKRGKEATHRQLHRPADPKTSTVLVG